jgi:hypothetical protein
MISGEQAGTNEPAGNGTCLQDSLALSLYARILYIMMARSLFAEISFQAEVILEAGCNCPACSCGWRTAFFVLTELGLMTASAYCDVTELWTVN